MASVKAIPVELMTAIFSFLCLMDLVRASWICRHWRRLALNHPSFWSNIRIDAVTPSALFWARRRLTCTSGRPFRLEVDYRARDKHVERELLDLVCIALDNVRELYITLDSFYAISVYETLLNIAKSLEVFGLQFILGPGGEPFELEHLPLRSGIFGRCPARLRTVSLENVILTHITPIPAFCTVTSVAIAFEESVRYQFPEYLFEYFPAMTWLSLSSGSTNFSSDLAPKALSRFSTLLYLYLAFSGRCVLDVFRYVATADIPEICVVNPNDDAVYAALEPLRSPFHMFCQKVTSVECAELRITIASPGSGLTRHFAENPDNYAIGSENGPLTLLENEDFAQQISSLTLATSIWSMLLPFLPPYNILRDLRISIDHWAPVPVNLPEESLWLPNLEFLLLESLFGELIVSAESLIAFLGRTTERVHLRLCGVAVVGDITSLKARTAGIRKGDKNELSKFRYT
ncbi:hypothetical protein AURDEDRAFT_174569 [Auricularia subglabra TFB-10046 SS5]|uniref:F-box domain-containing protein n=1 Tax=Auricularia subglabra (strain TFB-10046 / SS5) TaxID=717982 RepID=J0WSW6_AURST|nr:hypothetical protein AURDEDRAFT_174569 [Auricularia subglabra TFB-10046 SS5]